MLYLAPSESGNPLLFRHRRLGRVAVNRRARAEVPLATWPWMFDLGQNYPSLRTKIVHEHAVFVEVVGAVVVVAEHVRVAGHDELTAPNRLDADNRR